MTATSSVRRERTPPTSTRSRSSTRTRGGATTTPTSFRPAGRQQPALTSCGDWFNLLNQRPSLRRPSATPTVTRSQLQLRRLSAQLRHEFDGARSGQRSTSPKSSNAVRERRRCSRPSARSSSSRSAIPTTTRRWRGPAASSPCRSPRFELRRPRPGARGLVDRLRPGEDRGQRRGGGGARGVRAPLRQALRRAHPGRPRPRLVAVRARGGRRPDGADRPERPPPDRPARGHQPGVGRGRRRRLAVGVAPGAGGAGAVARGRGRARARRRGGSPPRHVPLGGARGAHAAPRGPGGGRAEVAAPPRAPGRGPGGRVPRAPRLPAGAREGLGAHARGRRVREPRRAARAAHVRRRRLRRAADELDRALGRSPAALRPRAVPAGARALRPRVDGHRLLPGRRGRRAAREHVRSRRATRRRRGRTRARAARRGAGGPRPRTTRASSTCAASTRSRERATTRWPSRRPG